MQYVPVLDHGFVKLVDSMGSDHTVSQAARMSFGKETTELTKADIELIKGLAAKHHETPFRHPHVLLHIKFPVFVARQLMRHNVGITWSEKSMRYTDASDASFYIPSRERLDGEALTVIWEANLSAMRHYRELLELGTKKELARTVLPVSVYTEVYMTASLQALTHLIKLRDDRHAQIETQEYARAIKKIVTELFPVSVNALLGSE